ncbi:MAG: hypothetical protein OP8BY_1156 [Candidatus Saccharicenans subterraneus]|uniref:Uncharacterized protein n=1 Tax=Candidatus Saccharicenans subterraneus TaxID=2508984 RepID=A0A3E2BK08_9BACT|nr:MAG: hypothetical protein OP8BY_1156 [Candidatus Saccharicenans subterraneum]
MLRDRVRPGKFFNRGRPGKSLAAADIKVIGRGRQRNDGRLSHWEAIIRQNRAGKLERVFQKNFRPAKFQII